MAAKKASAKPKRRSAAKTKSEKSVSLTLTISELEFLRDVFSMTVFHDMHDDERSRKESESVCQLLAEATERSELEHSLWDKVAEACTKNDVSTDDDAPNYFVTTAMVPITQIYRTDD